MNVTIIGRGQIGKAFSEVLRSVVPVEAYDRVSSEQCVEKTDILIIAFPYYGDIFCSEVKRYQEMFHPDDTVIVSTVPIGTCSRVGAVHSPVEGKHPHLAESIRKGVRWIGGICGYKVMQLFEEANLEIKQVAKPEYTEFLKLRSTSLYGVNIEFARYSKSVADSIGMNFKNIKEFDQDYNDLYKELNMPQFQRYILDPPEGDIGGHCVVPNAEILDKQYPNNFLKKIYDPQI